MNWVGRACKLACAAAAVGITCAGLPMPARAGDWAGTAQVGETVEANSNPQLEPKSPGGEVGSITNLSLQAIDTLPTLRWETDANLGLSGFWGPGAFDSNNGFNGVARTALDKSTELTNYHASISGSVLPASVSQVLDSGLTNANTTTITYFGEGGLTHQLNALNAFGLSLSGSSEFFTGNNGSSSSTSSTKNTLTPNTYLTTGQSWIHTVTPTTGLTVAGTTAWYTAADGVGSADSVSESLTGQIQTQLSERLNLMVGGGGYVVRTTGSSGSSAALDSTSTGFIANALLGYALTNVTSISAFASHNLAPSSLGSLQELTQAGLTVGHQINEASSLSFNGTFLYQLPVTSIAIDTKEAQRQALVLSIGYQRILSQYWNLNLAYNFTQQDNGDAEFFESFNDKGSSNSHAVFLTLARHFNLFGSAGSTNLASPTVPNGFPGFFTPTVSPARMPAELTGVADEPTPQGPPS